MKIDAALVHCNVMQIYFDHRHVHIRRPKLIFLPPTVCFFLKVTTVASAVLIFVEDSWPQPNLISSKKKTFGKVKRVIFEDNHVM